MPLLPVKQNDKNEFGVMYQDNFYKLDAKLIFLNKKFLGRLKPIIILNPTQQEISHRLTFEQCAKEK